MTGKRLKKKIDRVEKDAIINALKICDGCIRRAADYLGEPESTLRYRMRRLGVKP